MGSFLGGSKSKSKSTQSSSSLSENVSYPWMQDSFSTPSTQLLTGASDEYSNLINGGFDEYQKTIGADFTQQQGREKILGSLANSGVGQSGAALKALTSYAQGLNKQNYDSYLGQVSQGGSLGQALAALIGNAGQKSSSTSQGESNSSSSSTEGWGKFAMQAATAVAASDPRLKANVEKIGEYPNGLGIYSYSYIWEDLDVPAQHIGVMADEVAELQPEALGPLIDNEFLTVDYSKLEVY